MRKVNVSIESHEIMNSSLQKLGIIAEVFGAENITGGITFENVALVISVGGNIGSFTLTGQWDAKLETMPTILSHDNVRGNTFNFHPRNSMGELDIKAFERELEQALVPSKEFTAIQQQLPFLSTAVKIISENWNEVNQREDNLLAEHYPFDQCFNELSIKIQEWCNWQLRG